MSIAFRHLSGWDSAQLTNREGTVFWGLACQVGIKWAWPCSRIWTCSNRNGLPVLLCGRDVSQFSRPHHVRATEENPPFSHSVASHSIHPNSLVGWLVHEDCHGCQKRRGERICGWHWASMPRVNPHKGHSRQTYLANGTEIRCSSQVHMKCGGQSRIPKLVSRFPRICPKNDLWSISTWGHRRTQTRMWVVNKKQVVVFYVVFITWVCSNGFFPLYEAWLEFIQWIHAVPTSSDAKRLIHYNCSRESACN